MTYLVEETRRRLEEWIVDTGTDPAALSRIRDGLAATSDQGRAPLQQPTVFVAGLTARPWWDSDEFSWAAELRRATDRILGEFDADGGVEAERVVRGGANRAARGRWSVRYLYHAGQPYPENLNRFPETARALATVPGAAGCGMTYFSVLDAHSHVAAHTGFTNAHLRGHLGLVVPPGDCRLRVGDRQRRWATGELLVFDDSYDHEAWNETGEARAVLLFDLWHPELSPLEIRALEYLMAVWRRLFIRRRWFPDLAGTR